MKKISGLIMAVAIMLGFSLTAHASFVRSQTEPTNTKLSPNAIHHIEELAYITDDDGNVMINHGDGDEHVDIIHPGQTVYMKLKTSTNNTVVNKDAVSGVTITQNWDIGNGIISDVKIVQKKFIDDGESDYSYMLAITAKDGIDATRLQDVAGNILLKKTSGTDSKATSSTQNSFSTNLDIRFFIEVGYEEGDFTEIPKEPKVFKPEDARGDVTFTFEDCADSTFEINVTGTDRIVLGADSKVNKTIAGKYPSANLTFFNGNGATFNRTGTLRIYAPDGSYIYQLSGNSIKETNAQYNSYDSAFIIETKTLAKYVISDMQLSTTGNTTNTDSSSSSSSLVLPSVPSDPSGSSSSSYYLPSSSDNLYYPTGGGGKVNPSTGAKA